MRYLKRGNLFLGLLSKQILIRHPSKRDQIFKVGFDFLVFIYHTQMLVLFVLFARDRGSHKLVLLFEVGAHQVLDFFEKHLSLSQARDLEIECDYLIVEEEAGILLACVLTLIVLLLELPRLFLAQPRYFLFDLLIKLLKSGGFELVPLLQQRALAKDGIDQIEVHDLFLDVSVHEVGERLTYYESFGKRDEVFAILVLLLHYVLQVLVLAPKVWHFPGIGHLCSNHLVGRDQKRLELFKNALPDLLGDKILLVEFVGDVSLRVDFVVVAPHSILARV